MSAEREERPVSEPVAEEDELFDAEEWPAFASPRTKKQERVHDSERVRHLFPVPDGDWSVSDFDYKRERSRVS